MRSYHRPPIAVEIADLLNLSRLAMGRSDYHPLLWAFKKGGKMILGYLSSIPYWKGNLPIFAYTYMKEKPKGYLAYTSLGQETAFFTDNSEDTRYSYAAVVETLEEPRLISDAFKAGNKLFKKPVMVRASDLKSLMRVLIIMSDDASSPPIWHFGSEGTHILGIITPFFDYYEANALPVFFYIEVEEKPPTSFIRYSSTSRGEEISFVSHVDQLKYFYGRIVTVNSMPFYSPRRRSKTQGM